MLLPLILLAAAPAPIQEESKVPPYTLPDPLVSGAGVKVDAAGWRSGRRAEVLRALETHVYGRTPDTSALRASAVQEVREHDAGALGGKATRTQLRVWPVGRKAPFFDLLVYLPNGRGGRSPVFIGPNFGGNHTAVDDPAVLPPETWVSKQWSDPSRPARASERHRGAQSSRWQLEMLIARGYGLATFYYGDIEPDHPEGWKDGFRAALSPAGRDTVWKDGEWAAIGAWAWGLSRGLDVLARMPGVDDSRVAVIGHSRLGKAALWAGAQDERFAMVVSNDSGCGGAALSKRTFGETVGVISGFYPGRGFPHWFTRRFSTYSENEAALPLDQHWLLAAAAPRPLYVASAAEDLWADPRGEFLGALHADPVFRLLGTPGLGTDVFPEVGRPVGLSVGYHVRAGKHDVTAEDWANYLDFADRNMKAR
ncbi:MAG: acetylxylan esterase [Opitutales bacterium]